MNTQRKPKEPTPHEVDRGGRAYLVEDGKIWEGLRGGDCRSCPRSIRNTRKHCKNHCLSVCDDPSNGGRGYRTLHPVQAVG